MGRSRGLGMRLHGYRVTSSLTVWSHRDWKLTSLYSKTVLVSTEIASQLERKQFTRSNVSGHSTQFKGQECMVSSASHHAVQRSSVYAAPSAQFKGQVCMLLHPLSSKVKCKNVGCERTQGRGCPLTAVGSLMCIQVGLLNLIALSSSPLPELSSLMK